MEIQQNYKEKLRELVEANGAITLPATASKLGSLELGNANIQEEWKLIIPEGVEQTTSEFSLRDCYTLKEIKFPSSMTTLLGNFSHTGMESLYAENVIEITGNNSYGSVFNGSLITGGAFSNNASLRTVNLPSLRNLEDYAFIDCDKLEEVHLASAQTIGQHAFENCVSLTTVDMPAATELNYYVFLNCSALTSVNLPSAKTVCMSSFYGCNNLQEVYLPAVETIYFNKSLTSGKIYIGSSVQLIDFQVIPTTNENGETENIHEKHEIEIVLDSNGVYSEEAMAVLEMVSADADTYGNITISYEDFSTLE